MRLAPWFDATTYAVFSRARQRFTIVHQSMGAVAPHGSMYAETRTSTSAPLAASWRMASGKIQS